MSIDEIRREDRDAIATVTFTRDDKMNALTPGMFEVIEHAVHDLGDRDDLRVLVIAAEGRFFTAGQDVASLRLDVGTGTDGIVRGSNIRRQYRAEAHHDLFDEIEQIEKPVVLAAQSHCMGVGVELGASCDFRLASDAATFGLPEVPNLAVIPGSGGISRLTRLVGPHWAKWMAMAVRVCARARTCRCRCGPLPPPPPPPPRSTAAGSSPSSSMLACAADDTTCACRTCACRTVLVSCCEC